MSLECWYFKCHFPLVILVLDVQRSCILIEVILSSILCVLWCSTRSVPRKRRYSSRDKPRGRVEAGPGRTLLCCCWSCEGAISVYKQGEKE